MRHEIAGHQVAWCQGEEPDAVSAHAHHAAVLTPGGQLLAATVLEDVEAVVDACNRGGQLAGPHGVVHVENGGTLWCVQVALSDVDENDRADALGAITAAGPREALAYYLAVQFPLVAPELRA